MRIRTGRRVGSKWMGPRVGPRSSRRRRSPYALPYSISRAAGSALGFGVSRMLATKYKGRGQGTMTTTKFSTKKTQVRQVADGNTKSYFIRKALKPRGFKARVMNTMPLQVQKDEYVGTLSWPYGTQGINAQTSITNTTLDALSDLAVTNSTANVLVLNQTTKWMISNFATAGAKLKIYEGVYKRDCITSFDVLTLWSNGMIDTGSTQVRTSIGATPYQSPQFTTFCHVTREYDVFIPQGRTHEHIVQYNWNKMYNKELYNSGAPEHLRGWTRFVLFVAFGEPVTDTAAQGGDVSTGSGKLAIIGTSTRRFKFAQPFATTTSYTKSIPTTGLGSETLIDEGDGAVEVVGIAGS